jgi:hypothetical protein
LYADEEEFNNLFSAVSDLYLLTQSRSYYLEEKEDTDFARLSAEARDGSPWAKNFVNFTRFLNSVRRENPIAGTGMIFLSHHINVEASTKFAQLTEKYIEDQNHSTPLFSPSVKISKVTAGDLNDDILRLVKTRIWLSDVLLAFIPRDLRTPDGAEKKLNHIIEEVDHARLLNRWVNFSVEDGIEIDLVKDGFSQDVGFLSPTEGRYSHQERIEDRVEIFRKYFEIIKLDRISDGKIPLKIRDFLDQTIKKARERQATQLIKGFFHQFASTKHPFLSQKIVAMVLSKANHPLEGAKIKRSIVYDYRMNLEKERIFERMAGEEKRQIKNEITRDVDSYKKKVDLIFYNFQKNNESRKLKIRSKEMQLLIKTGIRNAPLYKSNLSEILRSLLPDNTWSESDLDSLAVKMLDAIISG